MDRRYDNCRSRRIAASPTAYSYLVHGVPRWVGATGGSEWWFCLSGAGSWEARWPVRLLSRLPSSNVNPPVAAECVRVAVTVVVHRLKSRKALPHPFLDLSRDRDQALGTRTELPTILAQARGRRGCTHSAFLRAPLHSRVRTTLLRALIGVVVELEGSLVIPFGSRLSAESASAAAAAGDKAKARQTTHLLHRSLRHLGPAREPIQLPSHIAVAHIVPSSFNPVGCR